MDGKDAGGQYSLAPFVFDKDHMTKAFITDEIKWVMKTFFFKSGKKELESDEIMDIVFT